jgi:transposase
MEKDTGIVVGMDLGDRWSHLCAVDREGNVLWRDRISTTRAALEKRLMNVAARRVVIEVGAHSRWVSRALEEMGHEVVTANARALGVIYKSNRKNDRSDAEKLARMGQAAPELLEPVRHRSETAQADLAVIKARDALVGTRTKLINHVRGVAKASGVRLNKCASEAFTGRVEGLPEGLTLALAPILEVLKKVTEEIKGLDRRIESLCKTKYPETKRLQQVNGVGPVTSLAFVLTLEEPQRFRRNRDVGAYLGVVPRQDSSGDSDKQLHVTKAGDSYLRRLLVGSCQHMLGPFGKDSDLRRWGETLALRGGKSAKKRAVVAMARKLAVLLLALWKSGEKYEPLRQAIVRENAVLRKAA